MGSTPTRAAINLSFLSPASVGIVTDAEIWRPSKKPKKTVRTIGAGAAESVMSASLAGVLDLSPAAQARRVRNGLPLAEKPGLKRWQRIVRNHYLWFVIVLSIFYFVSLFVTYRSMGSNLISEISRVTSEAGSPVVITWSGINEALLLVTGKAVPTAICFLVAFILLDRIRPTPWAMKWVAFGWGASVSVSISSIVNTWAGALMNAQGPVDPSQGARAAIYSAPFVEEAAKLTIVFWLAIFLRRRLVAVHQLVTMAGLSALGFAFVENIVYYLRSYMFAANISGEDPLKELNTLVLMRGVATAFGHPLFTSIAALGFVVGLVNRSKLVRFLAPVAGYLVAVLGHMMFNGLMSVGFSAKVASICGWVGVLALVIYLCTRYVHQTRNIRSRLEDFVKMGWLSQNDPRVYSSFFGRMKISIVAVLSGPKVCAATWRLMRSITELAYLRDAETRGLVDAWSLERQRDLILIVEKYRPKAITDYRALPWIPENIRGFFRRLISQIKARIATLSPNRQGSKKIQEWRTPDPSQRVGV